MAVIKRFEDLEIWKLSRVLCIDIYNIIETTNLKNNYKLCNQIDGSSGSIMDNIAGVLNETVIKNFYNFYQLQKHLVEKLAHNYIGFSIENLLKKTLLKN